MIDSLYVSCLQFKRQQKLLCMLLQHNNFFMTSLWESSRLLSVVPPIEEIVDTVHNHATDDSHPLSPESLTAIGSFANIRSNAEQKNPHIVGTWKNSPNKLTETLIGKVNNHTNVKVLSSALLGLGNSRHPDALNHLIKHTSHYIPSIRSVALRALSLQPPSPRRDSALGYAGLYDTSPEVRSTALEGLKNAENVSTHITLSMLNAITKPEQQHTKKTLSAAEEFFKSKAEMNGPDAAIARTARHRARLMKQVYKDLRGTFPFLDYSLPLRGSNAGVEFFVNTDFISDANGIRFDAMAGVRGELYGSRFDIGNAGLHAAYTSTGLVDLILFFAVYYPDPFAGKVVPYYVALYEWNAQVLLFYFSFFSEIFSVTYWNTTRRPM